MQQQAAAIEIFRAGTHTDQHRRRLTFSEADLAAAAAAYDPATHEAPLVVGHPKTDSPAYGWVKRLVAAGGALEAEPHQVDPAFGEMVRAGRFKKISAAFYAPDSPSNPKPGVWYLRHVGFLGGQPPAVKGLRDPELADGEDGVVEFADWMDVQNAGLWRRMREWLIGQFGMETADQVVPGYAVEDLEREANRSEPQPEEANEGLAPGFAEPTTKEDEMEKLELTPEELQARIDAAVAERSAEFAERERVLAEREAAARRREIDAWLDDLVQAGKALPQWKEQGLAAFVEAVDAIGETVTFAEGAAPQTPGAFIRAFVEGLGAHPLFAEMSPPRAGDPAPGGAHTEDDAVARALVASVQRTPNEKE